MIGCAAVALLVAPLVAGLVVHNETSITDLGTTSSFNQSKEAVVTSANYTTDEMVETSCHIISEQLVATATATVSSAFSDLCRTDQMVAQLSKLEEKYRKDIDLIRNKVDRILKHFMISETDPASNSTTDENR